MLSDGVCVLSVAQTLSRVLLQELMMEANTDEQKEATESEGVQTIQWTLVYVLLCRTDTGHTYVRTYVCTSTGTTCIQHTTPIWAHTYRKQHNKTHTQKW